jgi:hypothetical protein
MNRKKVKIQTLSKKAPISRRANLSGVRRTYLRRSDFEMRRNAEIGLFAEPSWFSC